VDQKSQLETNPGFFADLLQFVRQSGKWWLIPVVLVLLLFGAILILGGTAAAPFIYTLF
jgi:hypothetical protein